MSELHCLSASDAAAGLRDGRFSAQELAAACLAVVDSREPALHAWTYLDPDYVMAQARAADAQRAAGQAWGALHGVPVALKDVIDTRDMPTEDGTPLHAGRLPQADATVVSRLRAAGAVLMGKTVTTEFATYAPGPTRNPHDLAHTPGGSSSGSAAAVAAGMVPLALGTQTNGSVIRPAAFCGVVGFKPSFGLIPRSGVLRTSRTLDHVGLLARRVEDVALLAQVLAGHDPGDPDSLQRAAPPLQRCCAEAPPLPPRLAWVKTPLWSEIAADVRDGFAELAAALAGQCREFVLPAEAGRVLDWHRCLMEADIAAHLALDFERGAAQMSPALRAQIERGRAVPAVDYLDALARREVIAAGFDEAFDYFDALITPAVFGTAPHGLDSTGDPRLCTLWTYCGMPSLSLPLLTGENGLPVGVQLVGRVGDDARLLRTARWLMAWVESLE